MSACNRLSDRIPLVVLGQAEWTPDETRHLSSCRSCQDEWELVRLTSRMGEVPLAALDASATSRVVLERLSHVPVVRLRRRALSFAGLAAAATLVAVIWTERPASRPAASSSGAIMARLQIPLPELDSLQPAELDSVLQTMDQPLVDGSTPDEPGPDDLDSSELQNVLDYWEG
jgi:hypothetical protein